MTDRIKSARGFLNDLMAEAVSVSGNLDPDGFKARAREPIQTILEALSAYEKLQGVDLDALAKIYEEERQKYNCRRIYYKNNRGY